jgi:hypothetical protein
MNTLYFKCRLKTDVVLNQRAATEGNTECLDFIPGNNFLGIAASTLYKYGDKAICFELFHSGKVKFGDAHPALCLEDREKTIIRSLRIPACYYKPKLDNEEGFYISHEVLNPNDETYVNFQPKQCRTGFYIFDNNKIKEIKVVKSFAIKSAYDADIRRSKNEKMYGYQSLRAGSDWSFEIVIPQNAGYEEQLVKALEGSRRIGRSRTAQYGLIEIERMKKAPEQRFTIFDHPSIALLYADARLIFLDQYGQPTFQPSAEELGFTNGMIDWEESQIRTFQYAPWNNTRQARDTDRCGIEKGSVIVVKKKNDLTALIYPTTFYVGKYQNEGFGKVIVNPDFLQADSHENGMAIYKLEKKDIGKQPLQNKAISKDNLFKYLTEEKERVENERKIYEKVNAFVERYHTDFKGDSFASQWGTIRSIALKEPDARDIVSLLFINEEAYLNHGVAKDKWEERGRKRAFDVFISTLKDDGFNNKEIRLTIINLATEMAKIAGGKNDGKK